jgi:hypothetical protein
MKYTSYNYFSIEGGKVETSAAHLTERISALISHHILSPVLLERVSVLYDNVAFKVLRMQNRNSPIEEI